VELIQHYGNSTRIYHHFTKLLQKFSITSSTYFFPSMIALGLSFKVLVLTPKEEDALCFPIAYNSRFFLLLIKALVMIYNF
jgi:hypothetical protein